MSVMLSIASGLAVWGSSITDILNQWADMGIFAYVLPFLLIFALVFGILWKSKMLGENKGVIVVIALAVGLMALQFDYVTNFFAKIFPYAGIGISILLVVLIFMGLFADIASKGYRIAFFVIGAVIAFIVVISSLSSYEWIGGWWWDRYASAIIAFLVVGGLIAAVIAASGSGKGTGAEHHS